MANLNRLITIEEIKLENYKRTPGPRRFHRGILSILKVRYYQCHSNYSKKKQKEEGG